MHFSEETRREAWLRSDNALRRELVKDSMFGAEGTQRPERRAHIEKMHLLDILDDVTDVQELNVTRNAQSAPYSFQPVIKGHGASEKTMINPDDGTVTYDM